MSKFNNPYEFKPTNKKDSFPPSACVPNMAMSLNEILVRYTQGTLPNSNSFMQELPYNNGKLSPLARKGVDLCDYTSIQKQALRDVELSVQQDNYERMKRESATAAINKNDDVKRSDTEE